MIKRRIGISGIDSEEYTWRKKTDETGGAQIDLLIDRKDRTVNLCEMKFSEDIYEISAEENMKIRNRMSALRSVDKFKTKSIHPTLVTTFGLSRGKHSPLVQYTVVLDDFFDM